MMSLIGLGLGAVAFIFVLLLVMFPEFRTYVKGRSRKYVTDISTTPEGADAIYGEKIDALSNAYAVAKDNYARQAGKVVTVKKDRDKLKEQLKLTETQCENLAKIGTPEADESALKKAELREEILGDLQRAEDKLKAYIEAEASAKETTELCEKALRDMQRERKEIVENLKVKLEIKEAQASIDELDVRTGADKLIQKIREKSRDLDEMEAGAREVHKNKLSTQLESADRLARKVSSQQYLESLRNKQ